MRKLDDYQRRVIAGQANLLNQRATGRNLKLEGCTGPGIHPPKVVKVVYDSLNTNPVYAIVDGELWAYRDLNGSGIHAAHTQVLPVYTPRALAEKQAREGVGV